MKLKTKLFLGIGTTFLAAAPIGFIASCSSINPVKLPFSPPTAITKNGLSAFEGTTTNPTTALSSSQIWTNNLSVTLNPSSDANKYLGLSLPTTIGDTLIGATGFDKTAAITWELKNATDTNFALSNNKVTNKAELTNKSINTILVGTVKGNVTIDGKVEAKESKFELNVVFALAEATTAPTAITKNRLLAKEGTTLDALKDNQNLITSSAITNLSITLTSSANDKTFIGLVLPSTLGNTFTGATGFTDSANITWSLKTGSENNFNFDSATRLLTNKQALNTTGVTATLTGKVNEINKKEQSFEVTIKFVLHA